MRTLLVQAPALVYCVWVLVGLSRACTPPNPETTEFKAYRADIIVEALTSVENENILATVTKTLKGQLQNQESQITVTGFGTEEPCFWDNTDLEGGTLYVLFLEADRTTRTYTIVGNPDISDSTVKRKIRRTGQKGKSIRIELLRTYCVNFNCYHKDHSTLALWGFERLHVDCNCVNIFPALVKQGLTYSKIKNFFHTRL